MVLSPYIQDWPERWKDDYAERLALMEYNGVPDAERRAEADIRHQAEQSGQGEMRFGEVA